ncbi:Regulator of rDNA transcription protein 5 [Saccharomyces pastorianus]|nr:Regulator of rDNA transcription protein 5 [Saccharomyces pastorianus]
MSEQANVDTAEMITVYISNLPFSASERDLHAFLSDYGATSVLIPTQTVRRFSKKRTDKPRKPLGIAFAQFANATLASKAIQDLNGTTFQNQKLFLKLHVPYEAEPSPLPETKKSKDKKKKNGKEAPETAPDTVYCHDLPDDVTDSEIRELFQLYSPQEIWIYRSKVYKKRCIPLAPHQITAALVTLQSDKNIVDICDDVGKAAALRGKPVIVKPAFVSKIQEIKQLVKDNLTNARDPPPPAAPAAPAALVQEVQNNDAGSGGIPPPPPSSSGAPALAAA